MLSTALPYFTTHLPEVSTCSKGDNVVLQCTTSKPSPVTWYQDDVEIPADSKDYVISSGETLTPCCNESIVVESPMMQLRCLVKMELNTP